MAFIADSIPTASSMGRGFPSLPVGMPLIFHSSALTWALTLSVSPVDLADSFCPLALSMNST